MVAALASFVIAYLFWLMVGWLMPALGAAIKAMLLPAECALLQWLQDRAVARTLGIDAAVVRMRRRLDGHG